MQLKWNHRFVPYNNDTAPGDRSNTSSPMAPAAHPRLQPQHSNSSAASPANSPALTNINKPVQSQGTSLPAIAPRELVTATCARCNAQLGSLHNSWHQVTNSYYLQMNATYRAEGLQVQGPVKEPGGASTLLQGCLIQTLVCNSCQDVLGFYCVEVPKDKPSFKHRQFLKLSKIHLLSQTTKAQTDPHIEKSLEDQQPISSTHAALVSAEHDRRSSMPVASVAHADEDKYKEADMAAVKNTNNATQTWREAHEDWAEQTKLTLSPGAFGRRILELGGGQRPKPVDAAPPVSSVIAHASQSTLPKLNQSLSTAPLARTGSHSNSHPATTLPPISQAIARPREDRSERGIVGIVEEQRRDITRIDAAVRRLQGSIDGLTASVDALRHGMRSRPLAGRLNSDDQSIDLLSDTVSNLSSKVGEVDGLRLQVEALKRRLKRVEEGTIGAGPAESSHDAFFHKPIPPQSRYESPFPMPHPSSHNAPPKLPPINGLKRPMGSGPSEGPDIKRARPEAYDHHSAHLPVPYPPQYKPLTNGESRELLPALPRPNSNDSMYTSRRGPGRPRKYAHDGPNGPEYNVTTPAPWERDGWVAPVDTDGYYRPLAPTPNSDSAERGRVIRRGSLSTPVMQFDSKRTRQRPMRNSDGILIRKDGKPDGRSVSSAQNLKRFYDKKMGSNGELDGMSGSPSTPTHRDDPAFVSIDSAEDENMYERGEHEMDSRRGSEVVGEDDKCMVGVSTHEGEAGADLRRGSSPHQQNRKHDSVMSKMFPNGVNGERTRLDQSAEQLSAARLGKTSAARLQDREQLLKEEAVDVAEVEVPRGKPIALESATSEAETKLPPVEDGAAIEAEGEVPTATMTAQASPPAVEAEVAEPVIARHSSPNVMSISPQQSASGIAISV